MTNERKDLSQAVLNFADAQSKFNDALTSHTQTQADGSILFLWPAVEAMRKQRQTGRHLLQTVLDQIKTHPSGV